MSNDVDEIRMKLAIVGTVGVPACYGGFETLAENLLDLEATKITVYCSSKHYALKQKSYKGASLKYVPLKANGIQSILYDVISIVRAIRGGHDTALVLGVSGALVLPLVRKFSNIKIVVNIDGLEWMREKWGPIVRRYLKFSEGFAVRYSDVIVADNQAIADYVNSEYNRSCRVIAYGGDHGLIADVVTEDSGGYALSLCRIEPENNVSLILEAFASSGKEIKFIGNWDHTHYGRQLKREFAPFRNIEMLDPVYDLKQLYELRANCELYVHGHSAGGTNPSLVEVMHFGKPVLAYDCNYNRATTENKAEYFADVPELIALLARPVSRYANSGWAMREIANRRYRWSVVREQYHKVLRP